MNCIDKQRMYYNSFAKNKILAIHVYNVCKFFENKHKHNTNLNIIFKILLINNESTKYNLSIFSLIS